MALDFTKPLVHGNAPVRYLGKLKTNDTRFAHVIAVADDNGEEYTMHVDDSGNASFQKEYVVYKPDEKFVLQLTVKELQFLRDITGNARGERQDHPSNSIYNKVVDSKKTFTTSDTRWPFTDERYVKPSVKY